MPASGDRLTLAHSRHVRSLCPDKNKTMDKALKHPGSEDGYCGYVRNHKLNTALQGGAQPRLAIVPKRETFSSFLTADYSSSDSVKIAQAALTARSTRLPITLMSAKMLSHLWLASSLT